MIEISVIICTYNRERYLTDALKSLAKQSFPRQRFEVVVVNNNSTDATSQICSDFSRKHPEMNFREEFEGEQGLSNARNKGIDAAESDIIAFMDDDAIATEDYVEQISYYSKQYSQFNTFGGKVIPLFEQGDEPEWMSKYLERLVSKVDFGDAAMEFPRGKYPVGCNMIFRKEVFRKHGKFNPMLKERSDDKYIFSLMRRKGEKTLYTPGIVLYHNIEKWRTEKAFIRKLAVKNGVEERNRIGSKPMAYCLKMLDYIMKLAVSAMLYIKYLLQGRPQKGSYLVMVFCYSIRGFVGGRRE